MRAFFSVLCLSFLLTSPAVAIDYFTIGTGGVTGVYYPTGGSVCRLVNKQKRDTKIGCSAEATGGSVYNINALKKGELDFAIAQTDMVYQAHSGKGKFEGKDHSNLRAVMALYPELLTLVVNKAANIKTLQDLKGKRINIGNPGSGTEGSAMALLNELGIKREDFELAGVLKEQECPTALKDKHIDGYFFVVGHPAANTQDAANSVDIDILPIEGEIADAMLKKYPYMSKDVIPGKLYKGIDEDISTIGGKAILITTKDTDDKFVKLLLSSIVENFESFKKLRAAYARLNKEHLLEGLSTIPLHPAAEAYYKEQGLIK